MKRTSRAGFVTPGGIRGASHWRSEDGRHDRSIVTIGQFDGVHLGHRKLIEETIRRAVTTGDAAGAVTFDRHPLTVLAPQVAPPELTSLEDKVALLLGAGLDFVAVLEVGPPLLSTEASAFVDEVLAAALGVTAVIVGQNFRFGRGAVGDPEMLRTLGQRHGFDVICPDLAEHEGAVISSTRIRAALQSGQHPRAAAMLGPSFARTATTMKEQVAP